MISFIETGCAGNPGICKTIYCANSMPGICTEKKMNRVHYRLMVFCATTFDVICTKEDH